MSDRIGHPGRTKRWTTGLLTGGGAVLACLLMATSAASASGIGYSAPWKKASVITDADYIAIQQGCYTLSMKNATFAKGSGDATWKAAAAAKSCKGPAGSTVTSEVLVQDAAAIVLPVRVPTGTHSVVFNVTWNVTAVANYSLKFSGTCPLAINNASLGFTISTCDAEAITQTIIDAELVDITTGQVVYATSTSPYPAFAYSYVENESYCYSGSCYYYNGSYSYPSVTNVSNSAATVSSSVNCVSSLSATTTSADKYAIYTYVGGDVVMEMEGYHGAASGYFNMKTGGNGARLVSIVET